ncbi:MAG: calcium/sodium antiporter [Nanoarchaeota archaeon]|nr:calcium/sodium antiporter [Nanoarchaeota archaeon]MBU0978184.1 calcium/sodium antiporter [Nanoarchaeota archaeon]
MIIQNLLLFILGLILLIKGADYFIKSSATIAKKLGVSEFIIGLTLVAFGTSVPELASSIAASINKDPGLILGNIVGSNIANIGLILGISAIISCKKIKKVVLKREGYLTIFSALLLFILLINKTISRVESGILLALYVIYLLFLFRDKEESKTKSEFKDFIEYFFKFKYLTTIKSKILRKNELKTTEAKEVKTLFTEGIVKDLLILLISGATITYGAKLLVEKAMFFSEVLNIPSTIIGVLFVAIGTSIPELGVTIVAARKGYSNLAIGNIVGSNIANTFMILGIAGLISPLSATNELIYYFVPFMIFISILLVVFMRTKWEISRTEGIILLSLYILFVISLFFKMF